jgi:hypothetical protein
VAEPHAKYTGETRFPLILQNLHRYFFYIAAIISVINTTTPSTPCTRRPVRVRLGNVILWVNVILLWTYTISCHTCRHVTGGRLKHFGHPVRSWTEISKLNVHHKKFA